MNLTKKIGSAFFAVLLTVSGWGCAGTKVHFDHVPVEKLDLTKGRTIKASSAGFQLLLLIPIAVNGRHYRAYEGLKKAAAGDYITDIQIQESWRYAFVGTVYRTTFKATAYPAKAE
ncbi:MAG TPA: hypothetical protein DCZ95_08620 [Verrucomicrobia bacterium]|nr:MAG: hypothetical protein A2X46_12655 [Lentisphaerae bacterium GWF2_57_35]HBA84142.1 hypothetical protein [Verrucomicrobiota bacterium]